GLAVRGGGSTIRGLVINRFGNYGMVLTGGGNRVEGNYIGLDTSGTNARGNGSVGLEINNSANNVVGGTTPADRNLISGNSNDAVDVVGAASTGNVIEGNYLGLDVTGTRAVANGGNGVWISTGASNNTVGGTAPGAGNVISGNADDGVKIEGSTVTGNLILGNSIG